MQDIEVHPELMLQRAFHHLLGDLSGDLMSTDMAGDVRRYCGVCKYTLVVQCFYFFFSLFDFTPTNSSQPNEFSRGLEYLQRH
jgi:hypothetical protein